MQTTAVVRNVSGTDYAYIPRWFARFAGDKGGRFELVTAEGSAEISAPIRRTGHAYRIPIYKREHVRIDHGSIVRIRVVEGWAS